MKRPLPPTNGATVNRALTLAATTTTAAALLIPTTPPAAATPKPQKPARAAAVKWRIAQQFTAAGETNLSSLTAPTAKFVFAVGTKTLTTGNWGAALDNSPTWQMGPIPETAPTDSPISTHASTRNNTYVAMSPDDGEADYVLKFDGAWKKLWTSPSPSTQIRQVLTISPTNTWVFLYDTDEEQSYAAHFDGTTWDLDELPARFVRAGANGSTVWSLTDNGKGALTPLRWTEDDTWRKVKPPKFKKAKKTFASAVAIVPLSSKNVWLVARQSRKGSSNHKGALLTHWNGKTWKQTKPLGKSDTLPIGLATADGTGGLWLAATPPSTRKSTFIHYTKGKWLRVPTPTKLGFRPTLYSLTRIPGTTTILASGTLWSPTSPTKETNAAVWKFSG